MSPIRRFKAATVALVVSCLVSSSGRTLATSGGEGGDGVGGAKAGEAPPTEVQTSLVPWKVLSPDESGPGGPLGLLWFPASAAEAKESSLVTSRALSVLSARCVTMAIVAADDVRLRSKYELPQQSSGVLLVDERDEVIAVVVPSGPAILVGPVETMVQAELDRRENEAKAALETANERIKQKDLEGATTVLRSIWEQRCVVPDVAKKAAKALKKIGQPVEVGDLGNRDGAAHR